MGNTTSVSEKLIPNRYYHVIATRCGHKVKPWTTAQQRQWGEVPENCCLCEYAAIATNTGAARYYVDFLKDNAFYHVALERRPFTMDLVEPMTRFAREWAQQNHAHINAEATRQTIAWYEKWNVPDDKKPLVFGIHIEKEEDHTRDFFSIRIDLSVRIVPC
jgi:hypothetical protein